MRSPTAVAARSRLIPAPPLRLGSRLADRTVRITMGGALSAYLWVVRRLERRQQPVGSRPARQEILLTLNFRSAGWGRALLEPLSMSQGCGRLRVVSTATVPDLPNVEVLRPPGWLVAICGNTVSRLLTFVWTGIRSRPDVVGGVHLLFNGLLASLVARARRARSLYVCVGGPNELAGGGLWSENRLFSHLTAPDPALERKLLDASREFDLVVTMGSSAAEFFRAHGVRRPPHVIPCGVAPLASAPPPEARDVDVILVARLVPLKRIDLFLDAIKHVAAAVPSVRAVIVGDGPLREHYETLSHRLGLDGHVAFLGYQPDVFAWFARARTFLLTSDSEGVSISLIEAMRAGAVPVVSHVGDLADVVTQGRNGFLVAERDGAALAEPLIDLLTSPAFLQRLSAAARDTAGRYDPCVIAEKWNAALVDAAGSTRSAGEVSG